MLHQCYSKDNDDNYSNSNSNNKNVIYPGGSHYSSEIQHFPVGKETGLSGENPWVLLTFIQLRPHTMIVEMGGVVDGHYAGLK